MPRVHATLALVGFFIGCGSSDEDAGQAEVGVAQSSLVTTYAPADDAYVDAAAPNSTHGTLGQLRLDDNERFYLKFVVGATSDPIQSAILRLYAEEGTANGPAAFVAASDKWSEATITWNNQPGLTGGSPMTAGPALDDKAGVANGTWVEFDVTYHVSGQGVYSFVLSPGVAGDPLVVTSDEGLITSNRPQLVITTTVETTGYQIQSGSGTTDAELVEGSSINIGGNASLEVVGTSGAVRTSIIRFDTSVVPAGRTVESASLTINVTDASTGADFYIYELREPWAESAATWYDYAASSAWGTPGALADSDRDQAFIVKFQATTTGAHVISFGTAGREMLERWIENSSSNHGMAIVASANHTDSLEFHSSEASHASDRPILRISARQSCQSPYNGMSTTVTAAPATVPGYSDTTSGGKAYYDPVYGTKIIRVTGNSDEGVNAYSYWSALNSNSTRLMIRKNGTWTFYTLDKSRDETSSTSVTMPYDCDAETAQWSQSQPGEIFCSVTEGNGRKIRRYEVTNTSLTLEVERDLAGLTTWLSGEDFVTHLSVADDDDLFTFHSKGSGNTYRVFLYRWSTNEIVWIRDYSGLILTPPARLDESHIDKAGRYVLINWVNTSEQDQHDICKVPEGTCDTLAHDSTDKAGGHWVRSAGYMWGEDIWGGGGGPGLLKRNYSDPFNPIEAMAYPSGEWHAAHLSANSRDTRWFEFSLYAHDDVSTWVGWEDEVLVSDGFNWVRRLLHHQSFWLPECPACPTVLTGCTCTANEYDYYNFPRASLSYDGKWIAFTSNFKNSGKDVYLAKVPAVCIPQ